MMNVRVSVGFLVFLLPFVFASRSCPGATVTFEGRLVDLQPTLLVGEEVTIIATRANGQRIPLLIKGRSQPKFVTTDGTYNFSVVDESLIDLDFIRLNQVTQRLSDVFVGPTANSHQVIDVAVPKPKCPPPYFHPAQGARWRCR